MKISAQVIHYITVVLFDIGELLLTTHVFATFHAIV